MTPQEQEDEQFYRDTESVAFPKLDDRQLSLLEPLAEIKPGETNLQAALARRPDIRAADSARARLRLRL